MTAPAIPGPAIGDLVFFEGLPHRISALTDERVEFASELQFRRPDGSDVPQFRSVGSRADLRWSSRFNVWYLWGRLLGKARGEIGADQRQIVTELRNAGLLPARSGWQRGQGPAPGEQLGLYYCLFSNGDINWAQELANVRRGDGLSDAARTACATFDITMKCKFGYADPDDGDPAGTTGGD